MEEFEYIYEYEENIYRIENENNININNYELLSDDIKLQHINDTNSRNENATFEIAKQIIEIQNNNGE